MCGVLADVDAEGDRWPIFSESLVVPVFVHFLSILITPVSSSDGYQTETVSQCYLTRTSFRRGRVLLCRETPVASCVCLARYIGNPFGSQRRKFGLTFTLVAHPSTELAWSAGCIGLPLDHQTTRSLTSPHVIAVFFFVSFLRIVQVSALITAHPFPFGSILPSSNFSPLQYYLILGRTRDCSGLALRGLDHLVISLIRL